MMTQCTMLIHVRTAVSTPDAPNARIGGFSETVHDDEADVTRLIRDFEKLCELRARLLPIGAAVVGQRYQQVDPVGPAESGHKRYPGASALAADVPQMALLVNARGIGVRNTRTWALRGMPDSRATEGEFDPGNQTFNNSLTAYFAELFGYRFPAVDLSQTAYPLINISAEGVFKTEGNTTLAIGDMVKVLRGNTTTGKKVGGRFKIVALPTANSGTLGDYDLGPVKKGSIRKDLAIWPEIAQNGVRKVRITMRKVGRPFDLYVGRA